MPHQMNRCAQAMLRLLSLRALFIHGNLGIISSTTSYVTFNTVYPQPIRKEKLTNPEFPPFSHSEMVFSAVITAGGSTWWSFPARPSSCREHPLNSRNDARERHISWMVDCHRERFPQHFQEHALGDLQEHQRVFQVQASDALSGQD